MNRTELLWRRCDATLVVGVSCGRGVALHSFTEAAIQAVVAVIVILIFNFFTIPWRSL